MRLGCGSSHLGQSVFATFLQSFLRKVPYFSQLLDFISRRDMEEPKEREDDFTLFYYVEERQAQELQCPICLDPLGMVDL